MRTIGVGRYLRTLLVWLIAGWAMAGCAAQRADGPLRLAVWPANLEDHVWEPAQTPVSPPAEPPHEQEVEDRAERPSDDPGKPWHIDLAMRGSYTKLGSTAQQLDRRLDLPLMLDVFHVFDEPYTPLDRRTDLGLTTWYVGAGRQESEYVVWTWYIGGGMGQDLNHQRFFNFSLEVDFRYGYYYTGVTAEIYPWRVPQTDAGMDWTGRLRASRPFLLAGFETGYVSAEGEGDYKMGRVLVYHDEQKIRDWLAGIIVGAGWSFPLSERWSVNLMGDYTFHFYRPEEYNGWNWITAIRYTF